MKKRIMVAAVTVLLGTSVWAQGIRIGVHSGADAARMTLAGATGEVLTTKTGITAGVHFKAQFSPAFGLQTELNYSQQGTGIVSAENGFGSFNMDYLTIPVLAKFYGTAQLSFFAGPQLGIRLNGKVKSTNELEDNLDEILKTTDFHLVFGGEYRFSNNLFVNGRYNLGMVNIAKDENGLTPEIKNRYWSFRVGYSFKLGK